MLTFQELIYASPFYHAEIIGGWKGKEKSFSIVEDDPAQIDKLSLLIIPSDAETLSRLSEYLSLQNVQGILLVGEVVPYIPQPVIELTESCNKPILFLQETFHPFNIKKTISDLAQLKTMGLYQYIYEHSTNYWLPLIQEHGLKGFLHRISFLIDQEIFLLDEHFYLHPVHEGHEKLDLFKHLASIHHQQTSVKLKKEVLSMIQDDHYSYFIFPLFSGDQQYGFLLFQEQPSMMIDICTEQVLHTIPALLSYFQKEEAVLSAHQSYQEDFLYNLLYNNLESEQLLIKKGKQWGWDFTKPIELMVLRLNQKNEITKLNMDTESIRRKIHSLIAAQFLQGITFPLQGDIVILIFDSKNLIAKQRKAFTLSLAQHIYKNINRDLSDLECEIGIGRHYSSNIELFRSFYEAKVAIELGKNEMRHESVRHFEDIGIARLLSNIHQPILHDYYVEVLNDILVDEENSTIYFETLEAFYQNNADINLTAEQLYVHPNTLRKRLKKIETILHVDFNRLDDLLEIYIALKIMKMIR